MKTCRLGDLFQVTSGGTPDKSEQRFWKGDIPWISAKEMIGERVIDSSLHITDEGLRNGSRIAPTGSLLLLTRGSGLFKRIPLCIVDRPVAYNQDVKCIRSKHPSISNTFLFYLLKAHERQIAYIVETTGIGAGKLSTDRLLSLTVELPDEQCRDKIVQIACAFSNKIALNNRINDYLAALGETLVSNCKADIALSNVCTLVSDKSDVSSVVLERYVSTESLLPDRGGRQQASSVPESGKVAFFRTGDVLVSNIRPYFKKIWRASFEGGCSTDVLVFRAKDASYSSCLYFSLRRIQFFDFVMKRARRCHAATKNR